MNRRKHLFGRVRSNDFIELFVQLFRHDPLFAVSHYEFRGHNGSTAQVHGCIKRQLMIVINDPVEKFRVRRSIVKIILRVERLPCKSRHCRDFRVPRAYRGVVRGVL